MSLVGFAIRVCLKRALLGRTLAGARVHDSMVVPLDETLPEGAAPRIVISTDDDSVECTSFSLDLEGRELEIIIESELSSAVPIGTDGAGLCFEIPPTDAGLEASLDFLQREIFRALAEPGGLWSDLFRRLVGDLKRVRKRRGAGNDKGVKFAARQVILTCMPTNEPAYGSPPNKLWSELIAAMKADEELLEYGDYLGRLIEGKPLPSWAALQAALGYTDAQADVLAAAPADPAVTGEAPLFPSVTLAEVDATGTPLRTETILASEPAIFESGA